MKNTIFAETSNDVSSATFYEMDRKHVLCSSWTEWLGQRPSRFIVYGYSAIFSGNDYGSTYNEPVKTTKKKLSQLFP